MNAQSLGKFVVIPDEQLSFTGDVARYLGGYTDVEPDVKTYENNIFILVNNLPEQNNIKKCYKSVVEVKLLKLTS